MMAALIFTQTLTTVEIAESCVMMEILAPLIAAPTEYARQNFCLKELHVPAEFVTVKVVVYLIELKTIWLMRPRG